MIYNQSNITRFGTTFEEPPWIKYPGTSPYWGGWRQGESEYWLNSKWRSFWNVLTPELREEYLTQYSFPDEEWKYYFYHIWDNSIF
jgi:hypothetical protein